VKRGHLNVPVIGVAKAGWNLDQLRTRAKDSLGKYGGLDPAAFEKLTRLLRYVDGDYQDPSTFTALRKELQDAQRPAHYLAIPPVLFEVVVEHLAQSNCARGGRIIVEKPFGHDLASAQELNKVLLGVFEEADIFRIDHYLGKRAVHKVPTAICLRTCSGRKLVETIRTAHGGRKRIPPEIAVEMAVHHSDDALTEREIDVLRQVASGNANKIIADHLEISEETVEAHMRKILSKLGANDRTHAVAIALKRGIIEI